MVVLRCTRKLLRWLREKPVEDGAASSTLLGDWYANLLWVYRKPLILAVSARTLLPVLIPARDSGALAPRLAAALGEVLGALGVPLQQLEEEQRQMAKFIRANEQPDDPGYDERLRSDARSRRRPIPHLGGARTGGGALRPDRDGESESRYGAPVRESAS